MENKKCLKPPTSVLDGRTPGKNHQKAAVETTEN